MTETLPEDVEMEQAISTRDIERLARELRRRLDSCPRGTGVSFRLGETWSPSWRGTSRGEDAPVHEHMALAAAKALIKHAKASTTLKKQEA